MSKYRINVRFDLDKPKEANAAQYLQALDKSRNAFITSSGMRTTFSTTGATSSITPPAGRRMNTMFER